MNLTGRTRVGVAAAVTAVALVAAACSGNTVGDPTTTTNPPASVTTIAPASTITTTTTTTVAYPVPDGEVARVVSVHDGDTITVVVGGVREKVRLIGINTPEIGECYADEATRRLEELVDGREVLLSTDVNDRDQYERLLRYVWTDDGFVNATMVEEGLALARRYAPDTAFADMLDAAQARAEADGRGLWAADACGTATTADVVISDVRYDAPGDDGKNLNGEWVEIENRGPTAVDLTGWMLKDESASHRYTFPDGFALDPGATVTVYTGCGDDTADEVYWCEQGSAVWNNSGDTAFLSDPSGNITFTYSYDG
jgi:micrococcal nuclease